MRIKPGDLAAQYRRAVELWPFLHDTERAYGLPSFLLFALGSRETDLHPKFTQGATGDKGHGHGLFQLDDRWHKIPKGFDTNPRLQADTAATKLDFDRDRFGDWLSTLNYYNSGSPDVEDTTGGDYGPDVWERRVWLRDHFGGTVTENAFAIAGALEVDDDELGLRCHTADPVEPPLVVHAPGDLPWADTVRAVIADVEAAGRPVVWVDGWATRGRPYNFNPRCVRCHHTATKAYGSDYASLGIVTYGRSDLPGPLSQFGIGRHTGAVYVIAAGYANDGGEGGWRGLSGNGSGWGIEAENDGIGEEWSPEAMTSYITLVAALARHTGFGAEMVCGHREWSPYKIDPTGIDMDWFRDEVARALDAPPETPPEEDDDMAQALLTMLDLAQGERPLEVPVPPAQQSGGVHFGPIVASFSAPPGTKLRVVVHDQQGNGRGIPSQDEKGYLTIPGGGRHGAFDLLPGDTSVQVEIAEPEHALVGMLLEIGPVPK